VWRTQSPLELAIVAYIGWYNHDRCTQRSAILPQPQYETLALTRPCETDPGTDETLQTNLR